MASVFSFISCEPIQLSLRLSHYCLKVCKDTGPLSSVFLKFLISKYFELQKPTSTTVRRQEVVTEHMAEDMALQLGQGQVELQPQLATPKEDMTRAVLPTMPSHRLKVTGVATVPLVPQLILMARHRKVCILNLSGIDTL